MTQVGLKIQIILNRNVERLRKSVYAQYNIPSLNAINEKRHFHEKQTTSYFQGMDVKQIQVSVLISCLLGLLAPAGLPGALAYPLRLPGTSQINKSVSRMCARRTHVSPQAKANTGQTSF